MTYRAAPRPEDTSTGRPGNQPALREGGKPVVPSLPAAEQARRLIDLARAERLAPEAADLTAQARVNPHRMVELVLFLADAVATAQRFEFPDDDDAFRKYLRRCHAAHARGVEADWVRAGEREYQRIKKAESVARRRASSAEEPSAEAA